MRVVLALGSKMAVLLDFVRNSIWHAFSTLTDQDGTSAPKSKLKVNHQSEVIFLLNILK